MIKTKVKPHRKCPCESKKKYRNCCGKSARFQDLSAELQTFIRKTQAKHQISTQYHEQHFGFTPEIKSC